MASRADRSAAALHFLLRASHLSGADDVPALAREAGRWLGADQTVIHLVDYDQTRLISFRLLQPPT